MIKQLAADWGGKIDCPKDVDGGALLLALAEVESSGGTNAIPRFERAYSIGGYYYRRASHVRELWKRWGDWASCSYSSWQIMFVTATELGFSGSPQDLRRDPLAIPFVVKYLNVRAFAKGATTVAQAADAYNSGSFADAMVPADYIAKVQAAYDVIKGQGNA